MVNMIRDRQTLMLFGGVLALLVVATIVGQLIKLRKRGDVVAIRHADPSLTRPTRRARRSADCAVLGHTHRVRRR